MVPIYVSVSDQQSQQVFLEFSRMNIFLGGSDMLLAAVSITNVINHFNFTPSPLLGDNCAKVFASTLIASGGAARLGEGICSPNFQLVQEGVPISPAFHIYYENDEWKLAEDAVVLTIRSPKSRPIQFYPGDDNEET